MENIQKIVEAKYVYSDISAVDADIAIGAVIKYEDGSVYNIPLDRANRHYSDMLKLIDAGELTVTE